MLYSEFDWQLLNVLTVAWILHQTGWGLLLHAADLPAWSILIPFYGKAKLSKAIKDRLGFWFSIAALFVFVVAVQSETVQFIAGCTLIALYWIRAYSVCSTFTLSGFTKIALFILPGIGLVAAGLEANRQKTTYMFVKERELQWEENSSSATCTSGTPMC